MIIFNYYVNLAPGDIRLIYALVGIAANAVVRPHFVVRRRHCGAAPRRNAGSRFQRATTPHHNDSMTGDDR